MDIYKAFKDYIWLMDSEAVELKSVEEFLAFELPEGYTEAGTYLGLVISLKRDYKIFNQGLLHDFEVRYKVKGPLPVARLGLSGVVSILHSKLEKLKALTGSSGSAEEITEAANSCAQLAMIAALLCNSRWVGLTRYSKKRDAMRQIAQLETGGRSGKY